jgi:hypothetical protein
MKCKVKYIPESVKVFSETGSRGKAGEIIGRYSIPPASGNARAKCPEQGERRRSRPTCRLLSRKVSCCRKPASVYFKLNLILDKIWPAEICYFASSQQGGRMSGIKPAKAAEAPCEGREPHSEDVESVMERPPQTLVLNRESQNRISIDKKEHRCCGNRAARRQTTAFFTGSFA